MDAKLRSKQMKKALLIILLVIVGLGLLAGVGFAGYRIGFMQGAVRAGNLPAFGQFRHMDPGQMPMHKYNYNFGQGNERGYMHMMGRGMMPNGGFGMGFFGFFGFFRLVWNLAILGLIVWFFYWLFRRSGYRITRDSPSTPDKPTGLEGN
jgi:hypothetical protein